MSHAHFNACVAQYSDTGQAAAAAQKDGTDGVLEVIPVNDPMAVVYFNLAKVVRKVILTRELLDRALVGHLELYAPVWLMRL